MTKKRESNFEALRLLAIFFIVVHHFVLFGINYINGYSHGIDRIFMNILFLSQGKVGVILFFSITAYFFCDSKASLHRSFKKAWILERTLLFWSLALNIFSVLIGTYKNLNLKQTVKVGISAFLPTASGCWWFATSYIGFLLVSPFLIKGISVLTQKWHFILCVLLMGIGLASQLPILKQSASLPGGILNIEFIILFVTIFYIKRYHPNVFTKKNIGVLSLFIGYTWIIIFAFMGKRFFRIFDVGVLAESFGWFILFNNLKFTSKSVNFLASHVFAVYLITEFPALRMTIWHHILKPVSFLYGTEWMILYAFITAIALCLACIGLDIIKSLLFKVTIDRNQGQWFEVLWYKINKLLSK